MRRWSAKVRRHERTRMTAPAGTSSIAFSPDAQFFTTLTRDGVVTLWDVQTLQERVTISLVSSNFFGVALSPGGRLLAVGAFDGTVKFWDMPGKRVTGNTIRHTAAIQRVAFYPDGKAIVASDAEIGRAHV